MKKFILLGAAAASFGVMALSTMEASAAPGRGHGMRTGGGFHRPAMAMRGPSMGMRAPHVQFRAPMAQHRFVFGPGHQTHGQHRPFPRPVVCFRAPCNPHVNVVQHHHHHNWWRYRTYQASYYRPAVYPVRQFVQSAPARAPSCWQQQRSYDGTWQWQYVCPQQPPQQPQVNYAPPQPTPAAYTPPQPAYQPAPPAYQPPPQQQNYQPQASYPQSAPQQSAPVQQPYWTQPQPQPQASAPNMPAS